MEKIGYIRYSSFGGVISNYDLDFILERYKSTEGLIIDIRQNGGGAVSNVFMLLSRFVHDNRLLYETQVKNGPEPDDFSSLEKVYAESNSEQKYYKRVAILTDRGSYSASSFFSVCTYALDKVFLVGDTTGGGLGLPNGGQLPNGWTYRFSITRTLAVDGQNYENGVPPDYTVILSEESVNQGEDNVIEFAVERLIN
jgi:C-terminal processing protease CtpA/Prc